MLRIGLAIFFFPLAFAQTFPSYNWIEEVGGTNVDTLAGIGTDAAGNIYLAGSTLSPNFPVKSATQSQIASIGLYRISGTAFTSLGLNAANSIAVDSQSPGVIFAASGGLGLKSADGGNHWATLPIPSLNVTAVAIDPFNDHNVFAATTDLGVFKSPDGGATWAAINNGILAEAGVIPTHSLWFDPDNSGVVFTYSSYVGGIYRSANGGISWQSVGLFGNLYFDPSSAGTVYVLAGTEAFKSADDGQTFQPLATPVPFLSILADPNQSRLLAAGGSNGIYSSTDGGASWTRVSGLALSQLIGGGGLYYAATTAGALVQVSNDLETQTSIGPAGFPAGAALVFAKGQAYAGTIAGHDVFVVKLDPSGNTVYSTYFGGSADDEATAMTVDAAGNVYVTGTTQSLDFPATPGAYSSKGPAFVFKLNPDGSLGYSTYFAAAANAIAGDGAGSAYLTGTVSSNVVPTTTGAYQTTCCMVTPTLFLAIFNSDAFLTKFDPRGSTLEYSTYLGASGGTGAALALGAAGSSYVAGAKGVYQVNATGSQLLASAPGQVSANAMAIAPNSNLYLGGAPDMDQFAVTPGAFQTSFLGVPNLPDQGGSAPDAIIQMDPQLKGVIAATYFGGPYGNQIQSLTFDAAGNVYAAGLTAPRGLPTRTPFVEAFGPAGGTGFLSELSGDLSTLLFSTYLGDTQLFRVTGVAIGASGSVVIGGYTGALGQAVPKPLDVYVNSIAVAPPAALRVDSVWNAASMIGGPISPGETIVIRGAGFGADSVLSVNGTAVAPMTVTATSFTAIVPSTLALASVVIEVQSAGATSNQVLVPVAAASPGVFSVDGSGVGQGYILNQDGTLNSQTNPAAPGTRITIFATGVGTLSFTEGYAVTSSPANLYIDGFYCDGVSAVMANVAGLAGPVYELTVTLLDPAQIAMSNPDLKNFVFPPQDPVILQVAGANSQEWLSIWITANE